MHIPDGILPPNIAIAGYAITGGITWYSLRQIKKQKNPDAQIPKASLLTAAFFVTSLIHIPIPPSSIHLVLNGMIGIILGYYAFPAILIGLFFQAVMFQHGGLSTLGVNATIMGTPAIFAYYFFQLSNQLGLKKSVWRAVFVFLSGSGALIISALMFTVIVITNISPDLDIQAEKTAISISLVGYAVQAIIEGGFTVMLVSFLEKVKPEMLNNA